MGFETSILRAGEVPSSTRKSTTSDGRVAWWVSTINFISLSVGIEVDMVVGEKLGREMTLRLLLLSEVFLYLWKSQTWKVGIPKKNRVYTSEDKRWSKQHLTYKYRG